MAGGKPHKAAGKDGIEDKIPAGGGPTQKKGQVLAEARCKIVLEGLLNVDPKVPMFGLPNAPPPATPKDHCGPLWTHCGLDTTLHQDLSMERKNKGRAAFREVGHNLPMLAHPRMRDSDGARTCAESEQFCHRGPQLYCFSRH